MCELFAYNGKEKILLNSYLYKFYSHCDFNPHGYALALFDNKEEVLKEPVKAQESIKLKRKLSNPIESKKMMAHIRRTSGTAINAENTHPFVLSDKYNRTYFFQHNGTIYDCDFLEKYRDLQKGSTDSERIFYYLIDRLNERTNDQSETRCHIIENAIKSVCENDRNKVNIMMYDGELFYVHMNFKHTLKYVHRKEGIIFSTKALTDEDWKVVTPTVLFAYKDGKQVYRGSAHQHMWIPLTELEKEIAGYDE